MLIASEIARLERDFSWKSNHLQINSHGYFSVDSEIPPSTHDNHQVAEMAQGATGWWQYTRGQVLLATVRRYLHEETLWDVGSGSGSVTKFLGDGGVDAIGLEPSIQGVELAASRGVPSIRGTLHDLDLPSNSLHAIASFDVLEHVENRESILEEMFRVLKPGGKLFLSLPAFPSLWSSHDEEQRHFLRYTKKSARREVERVGFTVKRSRYFMLSSLPLVVLLRAIPFRLGLPALVSNRQLLTAGGGHFWRRLSRLELHWSKVGFLGTSLLLVLTKP